jgi:riboflavin kinase/FMN adenylyltransferase
MLFMWIAYDYKNLKHNTQTALTIGAFDGVHLGHQALIQTMVDSARMRGFTPVVLTFNPLPRQVLQPGEFTLLSTLKERLALIAGLGVDGAVVLSFTQDLITRTAHDFVKQLVHHMRPGGFWIGPDFRFGRDRAGDFKLLEKVGLQYGFEVNLCREMYCWHDKPVHSSRIRKALLEGNLDEANGCLGRPYTLIGTVGHGDKRGRLLGFPTANLTIPGERMLPANGVYIARTWLKSQQFQALVNVGTRPTFNAHPPSVEAYLLDFSRDIYGAEMRLEFLKRLRAELKFPNAEALIAQMRVDEQKARVYFET